MVSYQAAVLILVAASASAQEARVLTYRSAVDRTDQPYALYLPSGYDPAVRYPLLVSLHGAGGDHRSGMRQAIGDWDRPRALPFLVAAPYGRGSTGYLGVGERDVLDVIAEVRANHAVDPERIYLTGVSMGGSGAYHLLHKYPNRWAAAIVVCGKPADEPPPSTPLWLFHGEKDDVVPVEVSRQVHAKLQSQGAAVRYTEFEGAGHSIAARAYAHPGLFDWMLAFRKPAADGPELTPPGPISEILSSRVSYVYGRESGPHAREAANWGGLRGGPAIHLPVFADEEPLPDGNVFLFGTRETNRSIARLRPPIQLKSSAARTHGLLLIYRAENRLVAVSSGLPWWAGKDLAGDRGFRWQWLSLPYRLLFGLPDWVLFEGSLDRVLAKGYFGRGDGALDILRGTGLVEIDP
jgi:predicted esterase